MGDGGPVARERVQGLLLPPAAMILQPWIPAAKLPGSPFDIASAYELTRQQGNGLSAIVDALCIGQRSPFYAGNLSAVNPTRSSHTFAQHLIDMAVDDENPIPPALHVYQSFFAEAEAMAGNRPMVLLERISNGSVTHARALIELRKRLENGAVDDAPYMEDARLEVFSIRADGTYFTRGGFFALGDAAHLILRGGFGFSEDGGAFVVMAPGTTSESATGASLAMARTSSVAAQIGDIYGIDVGTLTLQASVVRAAAPGGVDSAFKSKGLIIETDPLPSFFTAGNRGIGWDSDDDKLKKWDGSTYSEIGGVAAAHVVLDSAVHSDTLTGTVVRGDVIVGNATPKWARVAIGTVGKSLQSDGTDAAWTEQPVQYCGYPSWSLLHGTGDRETAFCWGPFGVGVPGLNYLDWDVGHESDGARQTSFLAIDFASDDGDGSLSFSCGVPSGFNAWRTNALAVKTKMTGVAGTGGTMRMTLTAYNPLDGTTSTATRDVTSAGGDDTAYVETTITPPGTWLGGDLLRFSVAFTKAVAGDGSVWTAKLGRVRAEWR